MGDAFIEIAGDHDKAGIAVIEAEFNCAALGVALFAPAHVVEKCVNVIAFAEHAAFLMQHVDVVDVPPVAFLGRAFLPPVDREVRPGLRVWGHVVGGLRAKLLQPTSSHEAVTREHIRAHKTA